MLIRAFKPSDADALADLFHMSVHRAAINDYSPAQVAAWSPSKPDAKGYTEQAVGRTFLVAEGDDGRISVTCAPDCYQSEVESGSFMMVG
jgi:putative acetyltransferase